MASNDYCSSVSMELACLLDKLQGLSAKIDQVPSIDKYKMFPQVQELKIIITELDDRISEMITSCPTVEDPIDQEVSEAFYLASSKFNQSSSEFFDYDFGG